MSYRKYTPAEMAATVREKSNERHEQHLAKRFKDADERLLASLDERKRRASRAEVEYNRNKHHRLFDRHCAMDQTRFSIKKDLALARSELWQEEKMVVAGEWILKDLDNRQAWGNRVRRIDMVEQITEGKRVMATERMRITTLERILADYEEFAQQVKQDDAKCVKK